MATTRLSQPSFDLVEEGNKRTLRVTFWGPWDEVTNEATEYIFDLPVPSAAFASTGRKAKRPIDPVAPE